jgi:hypothetical protein
MPTWKLNLLFIAGCVGVYLMALLLSLVGMVIEFLHLEWLVLIGLFALIMWASIKLVGVWLDRIEGK